jgi:beta-lactamase regulating signal transducer with metallopeptidase domain/type II secretory pathway component GspD/PulD (secretin)
MNSFIETLNAWGHEALQFAWPMFWQSSVLIVVLFTVDYALRRKVRAAVRYALWCLLLLKLLLPPSLALPTSVAWWLRQPTPPPAATPVQPKRPTNVVVSYPNSEATALASPRTPPATSLPGQSSPLISAAAWALAAWSLISVALLFWLAMRWRQVTNLPRSSVQAWPHPERSGVNDLFESAKRLAGVRRRVNWRLVDRAMSPAVCGLIRPVILLPRLIVDELPPTQLRTILLHELIHLRRRDVWINCLQALLQIFYWWHPLLWLANARIRRLREDAVDDAVMLALADQSDTYAPTLLEVAKLAFARPLTALGLVGILESRRGLRQRIERLMNFKTPRRAGLSVVSLLGLATFTALAMPMGEPPPKEPTIADSATRDPARDTDRGTRRVEVMRTDIPKSDGTGTQALQLLVMASSITTDAARNVTVLSNDIVILDREGRLFWVPDSAEIDRQSSRLIANHARSPSGETGAMAAGRVELAIEADSLQIELLSRGPGDLEYTNAAYQRVIEKVKRLRSAELKSGRRLLVEKLAAIRIEDIKFDQLPLTEVVRILSDEIRRRAPDGHGVNLLINPNPPSGMVSANPSAAEQVDFSKVSITLTLHDVRAADVLEGIVRGADQPIKYSLQDYAIVFSLKNTNEPAPLFIRRFKIDPVTLVRALRKFDPTAPEFQSTTDSGVPRVPINLLSRFFVKSGIDMDSTNAKSIFYNDAEGTLLVRGTAEDLDRVEKLLVSMGSPTRDPLAAQPNSFAAATDVQNGRLLFELGKLDQAEENLRKALAVEPENQAAKYYLDLVQQARNRPAGQSSTPNDLMNPAIQRSRVDPPRQSTPNNSTNLYVRTFKVDPNTFFLSLEHAGVLSTTNLFSESRTNVMTEVASAVKTFFSNLGVNLDPPSTVFFNDRGGSLLVRATPQDLDVIEAAVQMLNTAPPQVTVKVKFVEITQDTASKSTGFDWFLGNTMNPPIQSGGTKPESNPGSSATPAGVFPGAPSTAASPSAPLSLSPGQLTGILTDPQYRVVLNALQHNDKVNLLNDGQVTTLSGRQAQLQEVEMRTIVTNINPQALTPPGIPSSKPADALQYTALSCGPILDVVPTVCADGYTVHLKITATLMEFLGYENAGRSNLVTVYLQGKKSEIARPLPKIRSRQLSTAAIVWDGQTVVLGGLIANDPPAPTGGGAARNSSVQKNLVIFITPYITDPAGNRIHVDDEPHFVKTVPTQERR